MGLYNSSTINNSSNLFTGVPSQLEPTHDGFVDWDTIAFGRCRTVMTKACIHSIEDAEAIEKSPKAQTTLNNMAHFCMYGETEN